jgi:hypothetical protein
MLLKKTLDKFWILWYNCYAKNEVHILLRVNFVLDKNLEMWYNIYTVKSTKLLKDNTRERREIMNEWGESSMHTVRQNIQS